MPNAVTYTIMMKGLTKKGLLDEDEELFLQMEKSGCPSDFVMLNAIVCSLLGKSEVWKATGSLYEIKERCFPLEASTTSLLIDLFSTFLLQSLLVCT